MRYRTTALLVMMIFVSAVSSAFAQSTRRVFLHGDAGIGSMEDGQGGLGKGLSVGGGIGGVLKDEIEVELSVTRLHHEKDVASLNGDITSFMGRFLYRSGGPGSTGRLIAGAGAGYYSYSGVKTETAQQAVRYTAGGFAYETGAGVELAVHKNGFVRPELWLTNARGSTTSTGVPEPPYLIIRGSVSAGWRF